MALQQKICNAAGSVIVAPFEAHMDFDHLNTGIVGSDHVASAFSCLVLSCRDIEGTCCPLSKKYHQISKDLRIELNLSGSDDRL